MSDTKIQWHSGFVAAMSLEFGDDRERLIFEKEYNLNTKPLEVDLLVIKKDPGVQMANEIGKLFRRYNLLEYKSPEDHMDVDTFYKTSAYGCLYKAYGESVNERPADDITISIIRDAKPEGLFQYFKEHNIRTTNPYAGIYYVLDAVLFRTQIIVGRELKPEGHTWMKALSGRMKKQEMRELLEHVHGLTHKYDRELADSVLEVSIEANWKVVEELRGDERMCKALLELMEPEINKIVESEVEKKLWVAVDKEVEKKLRVAVDKEVEKKLRVEVEEVEKKFRVEAEEVEKKLRVEADKEAKKAIANAVRGFRDLGADNRRIQEILVKNYELTPEEAAMYL